ncbi:MAG TPA: hypothetical protein VF202_10790 [Trueperaceae bacterium]
MTRRLKPCGTVAAYMRHYRRGETPCRDCRYAYSKYRREDRPYSRSYQDALSALVKRYPAEFRGIYEELRDSMPDRSDRNRSQAYRRARAELRQRHYDEFLKVLAQIRDRGEEQR